MGPPNPILIIKAPIIPVFMDARYARQPKLKTRCRSEVVKRQQLQESLVQIKVRPAVPGVISNYKF